MTTERTSAPTLIDTEYGRVRGVDHDTHRTYFGIPYAAAPRGRARFEAPTAPTGSEEVFDATRFGPTAPQPTMASPTDPLNLTPYFGTGWTGGDDYLTVSIWSPSESSNAPVMVFVPGGGLIGGSAAASVYNGSSFARDGVVLVIVQHRLGVPGFLHLPDAPENRGMLDVIEALGWVRRNIRAFGGDPSNVTLFGESAGAILTAAIAADPKGSTLITRAIIQSGTARGAFTPAQARLVTAAAADHLGIPAAATSFGEIPDERFLELLPALTAPDLGVGDVRDPMVGLNPFAIVMDEQPIEAIRRGAAGPVDLLVGTNAEEGRLYLAPGGDIEATQPGDLLRLAARVHPKPEALVRTYRMAHPSASPGDLRALILGDALFVTGSRELALVHAADARASTFAYRFDWRSTAVRGTLGAAHVVELPFVFDSVHLPELSGGSGLLGDGPVPAELAAEMHAAWVRFATTGEPGWAGFSASRESTRIYGGSAEMEDAPRAAELDAWR